VSFRTRHHCPDRDISGGRYRAAIRGNSTCETLAMSGWPRNSSRSEA